MPYLLVLILFFLGIDGALAQDIAPLQLSAPAVSADGTTSAAPNGQALVTTAGTWAWSSAAAGRAGEYNINLNGAPVGIGNLMEVANGGQLYVDTVSYGWYLWGGNGWASSVGPAGTPPPAVSWPDPMANPGALSAGRLQFSINGWDCDLGALPTAPNGCEPAEFVNQKFWLTCLAGHTDCVTSPTAFLGFDATGKVLRGNGICYTRQVATCRP